jgi:hypothetical protein
LLPSSSSRVSAQASNGDNDSDNNNRKVIPPKKKRKRKKTQQQQQQTLSSVGILDYFEKKEPAASIPKVSGDDGGLFSFVASLLIFFLLTNGFAFLCSQSHRSNANDETNSSPTVSATQKHSPPSAKVSDDGGLFSIVTSLI